MNAVLQQPATAKQTGLDEVEIDGEVFYKISHADAMRPFFMSIVSDSNHWMFVSSNGGISAGRKNTDYALFPYCTDDKITESAEHTGCRAIVRILKNGLTHVWEPFSVRSAAVYNLEQNLYKSRYGNSVIFEEVNADLEISFRYQWCSSDKYGFVRKCKLANHAAEALQVNMLDGLQNILPYGVSNDLQTRASNLADAYKRSELIAETGLGIFALSAVIVDKAEPSEALKANVAWSLGLQKAAHLLSALQLKEFRRYGRVQQEEDVKGEKGAYFTVSVFMLNPYEEKEWMTVANVNQSHAAVIQLSESIKGNTGLYDEVLNDIKRGAKNLVRLVASSDGLQATADSLKDTRHFSNVLFNIMRGGIFDDNYQIEKWDFTNYLRKANTIVFENAQHLVQQMPAQFSVFELHKLAYRTANLDLQRLSTEYLPLKFSRRHGDPSRPWNQFSINTKNEMDGSKILDYQGNWRDIFQNWEALAHSYPAFIESMIFKFLNASTFDGYNPYRITKDGFDWETIEPDNPWSYIGYWGDHQVIYLLKFLEFLEKHKPGRIQKMLNQNGFVYANVPYRIKPYKAILQNPKDTIEFDHKSNRAIRERMEAIGADGALLTDVTGEIYHVSFGEKVLATVLAKLSNFVAGGGIWMNTQRPEWNDANNALVGNGLSMVTLCYLRRFLTFLQPVLEKDAAAVIEVSSSLAIFFKEIAAAFEQYKSLLHTRITDAVRKQMTDVLGTAASRYRENVYTNKFNGEKKGLTAKLISGCFNNALKFLDHAIAVNKRGDGLFHTYNLISYDAYSASVSCLSEMLEGQVAVLSSGCLSAEQSLRLLDALRASLLYRPGQNSYMLYPDKNLPGFLHKNNIPWEAASKSSLLKQLIEDKNFSIVEKDVSGGLHFNGNFRNANDAELALSSLDNRYQALVETERTLVLQIFEEVFNHKEFTGRSGTFFGYEGLGSVYWHMVSKLLLAVQEVCIHAIQQNADKQTCRRLAQHFYDINEGIGVHKSPQCYGAFPTDPYSHTPVGKGAQQPGMTGQVKEDILTRFSELGIFVDNGRLSFNPLLLRRNEFCNKETQVQYVNTRGGTEEIKLAPGSLFFTYCQVPVIYMVHGQDGIEIQKADGSAETGSAAALSENDSAAVFKRTGEVVVIKVFIKETSLK
ncbi:hypothetical protein [Foetidibacter luteolus]|uniref:hypothetical protein n=1 Tax=Foetidibacter luteolus TaxID=2608880 RepID=UPI00129B5CCA|nr:hypothetical protein [Foetidibacter luteolus]